MTPSLYERLGGEPAVMAAVDLFYDKVLNDKLTAPFFERLDMKAQVVKQLSFMTWAFGGPDEYKGRPLRASHAELVTKRGLSDAHFDAVAGHLRATLVELGISEPLIAEVMTIIGGVRSDVLGR